MGLSYKIKRAERFLETTDPAHRPALVRICRRVEAAQAHLNQTCADAFRDCISSCQGKCCKNIHADDIITVLDCVYILAMNRDLYPKALERAAVEDLFSGDCPFLKEGIGPCLFADNQKPERCIITFCRPVASSRGPVRRVRTAFTRLWWHVLLKRPIFWLAW